jgi:hypothetical protein
MRPSLRFLALAVIGWVGFRAATLGVLPGVELFSVQRSEAKPPPPIVQTQFPEIAPVVPAAPPIDPYAYRDASIVPTAAYGSAYPRPLIIPVYYQYQGAISAPVRAASYTPVVAIRGAQFAPSPEAGEWPISRLAAASMPARAPASAPMQPPPLVSPGRLDRLQLTMWATLRQQGLIATPHSLAGTGTLGGSQAGARLFYNVSPQLAAVLRSSSDVGRRGGELALGIRAQPLRSIPVWVTAERRQALGKYGGGRSAFALFAEGGVYDRAMPWEFVLDGYAQAGVVGLKNRDLFADGGFTLTRPVYRNFSAGFGVWGGVQPGLYRVDAGPRVSMRVRRNVRVHLDWRQRLSGDSLPASGPAVTLAGDF